MNQPVTIIAEAGVNHNGSIERAMELIDAAAYCGADIVKFQHFIASSLATTCCQMAPYQVAQTEDQQSQIDFLNKLELSFDELVQLKKYAVQLDIGFLVTGFDMQSLPEIFSHNDSLVKVPSGELNNVLFLRAAGASGKNILLSTGGATLEEIEYSISVLTDSGAQKNTITIMQCTTQYPAELSNLNLRVIPKLAEKFGLSVGYSDHSVGATACLAAVALGATVIEKHLTLDRYDCGPDHLASADVNEFYDLVRNVRDLTEALGGQIKVPCEAELENIAIARRSIVAAEPIFAGDTFSDVNITVKRPAGGFPPSRWDEVIGTQAKRDYKVDELID